MATAIEWCDETWNPTTGCTKVSPGCDHCYAERITERFHGKGSFDTVVLHPERLNMPLRWRKPRLVFVDSMSDLFHDDVPDEFIAQVFATMAAADRHQFQILTKRPGRMASWLNRVRICDDIGRAVMGFRTHNGSPPSSYGGDGIIISDHNGWPLPNVWLGTSVENQKWAAVRIPKLLETPAAVRFLSVEPLLGPVDLARYLGVEFMESMDGYGHEMFAALNGQVGPDGGLHWIIVGGESGPGARPMHPDWARSLRDQCVSGGVPFFFKQRGEWTWDGDYRSFTHLLHSRDGYLTSRADATMKDPYGHGTGVQDLVDRGHPGWVRVRRVGKHAAGRELDGRTWDEMPERVEVSA